VSRSTGALDSGRKTACSWPSGPATAHAEEPSCHRSGPVSVGLAVRIQLRPAADGGPMGRAGAIGDEPLVLVPSSSEPKVVGVKSHDPLDRDAVDGIPSGIVGENHHRVSSDVLDGAAVAEFVKGRVVGAHVQDVAVPVRLAEVVDLVRAGVQLEHEQVVAVAAPEVIVPASRR
jgi:hypothetical protein